jgi:cell pole-organizing protein PopZ
MSDQNSQEPTMEEILASIRRIISEDDAPAAAPEGPVAEAATPAPAPEPFHEPEPVADPVEDDVLELTDRLEEPVESLGDLDVFAAAAHEPPPRPAPAPQPEPVMAHGPDDDEHLVSPPAAVSAASAFGQLHRQVLMPADGRSLEDLVRELLRPLLKSWLDEHLTGIVQAAVEAEVDRIARQRR